MSILTQEQEAHIRASIERAAEIAIQQVPPSERAHEKELITRIVSHVLGISQPSTEISKDSGSQS